MTLTGRFSSSPGSFGKNHILVLEDDGAFFFSDQYVGDDGGERKTLDGHFTTSGGELALHVEKRGTGRLEPNHPPDTIEPADEVIELRVEEAGRTLRMPWQGAELKLIKRE